MVDEFEDENIEDNEPVYEDQPQESGLKEDIKERAQEEIAERVKEKIRKEAKAKISKKISKKAKKKVTKQIGKKVATRIAATAARTAAASATAAATSGAVAAATAAVVAAIPVILIVLAVVAIIVIILYVVFLFLGSVNGISSWAGGSIFLPADYNKPEHRAIVESLVNKRDGNISGHELVIYEEGEKDIEWKWELNETTGEKEYFNILDIRLLKTLDYLTDRHERIKIGMLKTNAPDFLYGEIKDKLNDEIVVSQQETISALRTGQAMAIVEVDMSRIPALSKPPIQMFWQKTFGEAIVRSVWEEIAFSVGYLDKNIPGYEQIANVSDDQLAIVVERYRHDIETEARNIYKEAFNKIDRIFELLKERAANVESLLIRPTSGGLVHTLDTRTSDHFEVAKNSFEELKGLIGDHNAPDFDIATAMVVLGNNTELIRSGAKSVYKATQVANMVNWNKKISVVGLSRKECLSDEDCEDEFRWWKAHEARNKIREVIKELLEMPREASLGGVIEEIEETESGEEKPLTITDFDKDLVVKQIVTFSPEDDLDNGLFRLDIYPIGINAVGVGGISFGTYGNDPESPDDPDQQAIGDGEVTVEDAHFSHMPIDNGVFSKIGTSYVYQNIGPDDPWWEKAGHLIFKTPFSVGGAASFVRDQIHDEFAGGCPADLKDIDWWFNMTDCRRVSYRDFLFVAF